MEKVKNQRFVSIASVIFFLLVGYTIGTAKTEDEENNISIYREVGEGPGQVQSSTPMVTY
jgi:hypothetical protein